MIRLEYYICMTRNTILATRGRPRKSGCSGCRRTPGDADAASPREIVPPKLMKTRVAAGKLEAHGVFATTARLENHAS
jgi:hypothetical protein